MWSWTNPVKEVLQTFVRRICTPYIENLDSEKIASDLETGRLTLRNLRLKKGALDKFRLPFDVLEGHLGQLTLAIPWTSLSSQPVEISMGDIYLLVTPASSTRMDPEDDERCAQAVKAEKLEISELFDMRAQPNGFIASLVTKIVNDLQVTVKNVHIRYENDTPCPGNHFAAGVTVAGLTVKSVDENWFPAFVPSAKSIYKLARLESLAIYLDSDSASMIDIPLTEAIDKSTSLISSETLVSEHRFILQPLTGECRIIINKETNNSTPRSDVQLLLNELVFALDIRQYHDVISIVDMYFTYLRRYRYRQFAPDQKSLEENRPRALMRFASQCILEEIHKKNQKHTWAYIKEVGEIRRCYMALFRKKLSNQLTKEDISSLEQLQRDLTYEDIQLYRSLADCQPHKYTKTANHENRPQGHKQELSQASGYGLEGYCDSSEISPGSDVIIRTLWDMSDEQQKKLYHAVDYDWEAVSDHPDETPRDTLILRVAAKLECGSFALKSRPHGAPVTDITSLVLDEFKMVVNHRQTNSEGAITLGDLRVFDGTENGSAYPQIVRVKGRHSHVSSTMADDAAESETHDSQDGDPFFYLKFEHKPLDQRADTAFAVRLRPTEVIYHNGYVKAVYDFFRLPESQMESLEAILGVPTKLWSTFASMFSIR